LLYQLSYSAIGCKSIQTNCFVRGANISRPTLNSKKLGFFIENQRN
jgi:hypothetical protein